MHGSGKGSGGPEGERNGKLPGMAATLRRAGRLACEKRGSMSGSRREGANR